MQAIDLDAYIDELRQLLQSNDTFELIVGIAGTTGRRYLDLISAGHFIKSAYPYLLQFVRQAAAADQSYDILTLLPAEQVLVAITKLRKQPEMIAIAGLSSKHITVKQLNTRVNRKAHRLLGGTGLVPVPAGAKSVSIQRLRQLYGTIALHYFCPPPPHAAHFSRHYLAHVLDVRAISAASSLPDDLFPYQLMRQGQILTRRGVKLSSAGLPPALASEVKTAASNGGPEPAPEPVATPPSPAVAASTPPYQEADSSSNRGLVETLQRIAEQQSQTIETQATLIAQLQTRIQQLEQQRYEPPPPSVQSLTAALQEAHQQQVTLHQQREAYHQRWLQTLDSLNQIRQALNLLPLPADASIGRSEYGATRAAAADTSRPGPPRSPAPQASATEGEEVGPYQRAIKIWQLTQQWNQQHPDQAILLNQSILNSRGIHRNAAVAFLTDFSDQIAQENQRIGVTAKNRRTFNRGKIEHFTEFLNTHE